MREAAAPGVPSVPDAGGRRGDSSPPSVSPVESLQWRVVVDPPLSGPKNMARDHALARCLRAGEGAFRLYRWDPPTISFGRNEPARGRYREEEAIRRGVGFVRRPTGGRAVLHHRELTYSAVFPLRALGGVKAAYRLLNQGLMTGLRLLGAPVDLAAGTGPALPPDAGPCFRQPAEGEVTALGRKLVGSAQVRMDHCVLQHGSLILDGDQDMLRKLRLDDEEVPPPATLRALLGGVPDLASLAEALQQGLAAVLGGEWMTDALHTQEELVARELEEHYSDPAWTWRI